MFKKKLKNFIKNSFFLWNVYKYVFRKYLIITRLKDVVLMMILFNVYPSYTYKFSTRGLLPSKKNRFSKITDPYKIIKNKTNIKKMGEVNFVVAGSSFKLNNLKKLKGKIFFLPGFEPLKIDKKKNIYTYRPGWAYKDSKSKAKFKETWLKKNIHNVAAHDDTVIDHFKNKLRNYKRKNITYCIARKEPLNKYLKKGYNYLSVSTYYQKDKSIKSTGEYWESKSYKNLFKYKNLKRAAVIENFFLPPEENDKLKWAPTGSVIPYLFAISKYAKKINVYGWDFYLEKSPSKMSYWQVFFSLYKYELDVNRSNNHFESALLNFYHAYRFSKLSNINIHGYLGQLKNHDKLIKKIEKVLYN